MTQRAQTTRVGLIGCGRIARVHLRYLQQLPGIEIVGFCDQDLGRAQQLQAEAGTGQSMREVADLLRLSPDTVHVLTPPPTHAEVTIAALDGGAHVLVEKPMATTSGDAARMEAAARASGHILAVDHNRLFDPAVLRARALVEGGAIGTLISAEAYQGVNVQEGGRAGTPLSMWMNLAPHPLSVLDAFVGEIQEWAACGGPHGEVRAALKGTHALASLVFSPAATPYLNALTLHGSTGTIQMDLNTMTLIRRRERRLPKMVAKAALNVDHGLQLLWGTASTMAKVLTRRMGTYPGIGVVMRGFYGAVRGEEASPVTAADGRRIVALLENIWGQAQDSKPDSSSRRRWSPGWLPSRSAATVLVTGAGGFLGRRVVAELQQRGHRVRAMLHSAAPAAEWNDVEVVHAALGDNQAIGRALTGVTTVVHCAARVARRGTRAEFFRDNVHGTAHLVEAARTAGVERFIHVSSIAIYGRVTKNRVLKENSGYELHPELRGAYTWSKVEADRVVQEIGRSGDLRTVILRPGILVGPDGPEFTARLAIGPIRGRLLIVGRRDAVLPLCHVDDVARAVAAAVTVPEARGAYNLVDESLTQDEWLRMRRNGSPSARPHYIAPALLTIPVGSLELLYKLARRPAPTLSRYKIRCATENLRYDISRARRDLGWKPEVGVRALHAKARSSAPTQQAAGLTSLAEAAHHRRGH